MTSGKNPDRHHHRRGGVHARGLTAEEREAAAELLAKHDWTINDYIVAAIRFLPENPVPFLARLRKYRPPPRPVGRPKKGA